MEFSPLWDMVSAHSLCSLILFYFLSDVIYENGIVKKPEKYQYGMFKGLGFLTNING